MKSVRHQQRQIVSGLSMGNGFHKRNVTYEYYEKTAMLTFSQPLQTVNSIFPSCLCGRFPRLIPKAIPPPPIHCLDPVNVAVIRCFLDSHVPHRFKTGDCSSLHVRLRGQRCRCRVLIRMNPVNNRKIKRQTPPIPNSSLRDNTLSLSC